MYHWLFDLDKLVLVIYTNLMDNNDSEIGIVNSERVYLLKSRQKKRIITFYIVRDEL